MVWSGFSTTVPWEGGVSMTRLAGSMGALVGKTLPSTSILTGCQRTAGAKVGTVLGPWLLGPTVTVTAAVAQGPFWSHTL